MYFQAQGYFWLEGIVNVKLPLTDPTEVLALQNLVIGDAHEILNLHDRVCSYMIAKAIEYSIKNDSLKKLRIHLK